MPTSPGKARLLLKAKKAKAVNRFPFTIQLLYGSSGYKQAVSLGVDTGAENVGLSALSGKKELLSAEAKLRKNVSEKVQERAMYRRTRRGNKTRYRKARFLNRGKKGSLAPSVAHKLTSHVRLIEKVKKILPVDRLIIEAGQFDIQKIKNPGIGGNGYQQGEQMGYENVKQYVLTRDGRACYFKGPCSKQLEVHHIRYRSNGGSEAPQNLITLCKKHHEQLHDGKIKLPEGLKHRSLKHATVMNTVRKGLLQHYPEAEETFGYVTKWERRKTGLEKSHYNDAFVIAGGMSRDRAATMSVSFKRGNNRSLQKNRKGFAPSIRRQRHPIQPQDLVIYDKKLYRAVGTQNKGAYLKITDGDSVLVKKVRDIEVHCHQKNMIFMPYAAS